MPTTVRTLLVLSLVAVAAARAELDAIAAVVQAYEEDIGPRNGARVVARAWAEPEYKVCDSFQARGYFILRKLHELDAAKLNTVTANL